jgi:hypothetical protein
VAALALAAFAWKPLPLFDVGFIECISPYPQGKQLISMYVFVLFDKKNVAFVINFSLYRQQHIELMKI